MNLLDYIMIAVLIIWIIRGCFVGFMMTITTLAGIIAGITAAIFLSPYLAAAMKSWIDEEQARYLVAYCLIFLIVALVFRILGLVLRDVIKKMKLTGADMVLGGIASALEAVLIMMIALLVIVQSPWEKGKEQVRGSFLAPYLLEADKIVIFNLPENIRDKIVKDIDSLDPETQDKPKEKRGKRKEPVKSKEPDENKNYV